MKRQSAGYTILEAMIFLAVSGVLFALIYPTISGRQDEVKFSESVRDLDSKIQDIINDVSTGYFPSGQAECVVGNNNMLAISEGSAANTQGTRKDCVFLGKTIAFSNVSGDSVLNNFTVVGKRLAASTNLAAATPTVVAPTPTNEQIPNLTESYNLKWGMEVPKVYQMDPQNPFSLQSGEYNGPIAIMLPTGSNDVSNSTKQVDAYLATSAQSMNMTNEQIADTVNTGIDWSAKQNNKNIIICVIDPGSDRRAAIVMGGKVGVGKTKVIFDDLDLEETLNLTGSNITLAGLCQ